MSTIEITSVEPHSTILGDITMWCVQPECDGEHHYYCAAA